MARVRERGEVVDAGRQPVEELREWFVRGVGALEERGDELHGALAAQHLLVRCGGAFIDFVLR